MNRALLEHLRWATSGVPDIRAIVDQRQGERRRRVETAVNERQVHERRLMPGRVSALGPVTWGMPRETVISLGCGLPGASSGLTRERHAGRASPGRETGIVLLFGLAPGGV